MIATMLCYEILLWVCLAHFRDSMPQWLATVLILSWIVIHTIAYASETNLRDRIKRLEDEVKKHKLTEKGGAE